MITTVKKIENEVYTEKVFDQLQQSLSMIDVLIKKNCELIELLRLNKSDSKEISEMVERVDDTVDLETYVSNKLVSLGAKMHLKGFKYLRYALIYLIENSTTLEYNTIDLYNIIAKHYDTKGSRVERAIRHGILSMNENPEFYSLFGVYKYKIVNSLVISVLAEKIRLEVKK